MKKKRKSTVRFIERYYESDDVSLPKWTSKSYVSCHTKRYHNNTHQLKKVDTCSNILINYLTEVMDESNNIVHTEKLRENFIDFVKKSTGKTYSHCTVKKCFSQLVKADLLIKYTRKSDYTVNPIYYYNGTEGARKDLLQRLLNFNKECKDENSNLKRALKLI